MSQNCSQETIKQAAKIVQSGGVIAYPTESVYGLGCDPDNLAGLERILAIKQRPENKGFIILISDIAQLADFAQPLSNDQIKRIKQARVRATTWLVPKRFTVSPLLSGDFNTIAVRYTRHPIAKALCDLTDKALVSTSCNLSGEPEMTDALAVKQHMGEMLDFVIEAECGGESPSQIIELSSGRVLRE